MIVFPAIDLQGGRAVRLKQGRKDEATVFSDNPGQMARHWQDQGARWLHVVDLDGAFAGGDAHARVIGEICREVDIPVQVGGGIRDTATAERYLDAGASRLIIGTMAIEEPPAFASLCQRFPGKIGVSLDAASGRLKTRGWLNDAGSRIDDVIGRLEESGAAFIIYTDIDRDGMTGGVNLMAFRHLLELTELPVIAAGGVATLDDIIALHGLAGHGNLEGVISGRALYDGSLDLKEAMAWLDARQ